MRNLLRSSFFLIMLWGCTLGRYSRLEPVGLVNSDSSMRLTPIFGNNLNSYLFRANIHIYGKDLSGLLLTRQMEPHTYRVVFTTELGMKLFDFEFRDTSFTLHYCVEQLNRKKLISVLRNDIEILLMDNLENKRVNYFIDKNSLSTVERVAFGTFYNYYYKKWNTNGQLVKIEHSKNGFVKTVFSLDNYQNGFPENIKIKHCDLDLKIDLNLIKK